jgi:valyl-tRNA synthetase
MNEIEPWCISRQIWWGHRIPAWYDDDKNIFVAENEKEALKLAKKKNKKKSFTLKQETDVLDTWFSSALWPFATLGWPSKTKELSKFYPTSVLVTGFDIIFFWVARMLMMGNFFNKKTPFHKVYVHALVRDEKGQKMSKSKGNVIDPLELINEYGADSLRFTLISMASPGRDVKLSKDRVIGNRNFITKIWSANNFLQLNNCKFDKKINVNAIKLPINQWIFNEFVQTQRSVSKNIEIFRFDEAAKNIYQFVWHLYCDWYLEFLKPIFNSKNASDIKEARLFSSFMMANILKMLHPFIPFFTESVWSNNNYKKIFKTNLISAAWPEYKKNIKYDKSKADINYLIEFITSIRSTKAELKVTPKLFNDVYFLEKNSKLKALVKKYLTLFIQVGRINNILENKEVNKNTVEILALNEKISIKFHEDVDLASQKQGILQKLVNLEKKSNGLKNKLNNQAYLKNAPKEIVRNDKKLLNELTIEDEKLRSIVSSIN